jgi:hypothetical protein
VLREFYIHHREVFGIGFDAGWRALQHILASDLRYVVVNTQDFATSVAGSRSYTIQDIQAGARKGRGETRHPRPDLSTPYVAPSTEAEIAIAEIWGDWLGIDQIGIMDNFFDLGGNSLIGVGVVDAVRRALNLDHLPAHILYQAPTVSAFAAVQHDVGADADGQTDGQSDAGAEAAGAHRADQRAQRLARRRASMQGVSVDD